MDQEQLQSIEEFAGYFFSPEEILIIMQLPPELILTFSDRESDIHRSFMRGKLKSEADVRKSILDLAKKGSAPAQALAIKIMEQSAVFQIPL